MESYKLAPASSPAAHKRIYLAMLHGDRAEARKAMEEHILYVRDRLLARLEGPADLQSPLQPKPSTSVKPPRKTTERAPHLASAASPARQMTRKPRSEASVSLSVG